MLLKTRNLYDSGMLNMLAPILGGFIIALLTSFLLASDSLILLIFLVAGSVTFLPTFMAKNVKVYWLGVFLFFLPLEAGKRITNLTHSAEDIFNTIGLPPSGQFGIKLYPTDMAFLVLLVLWFVPIIQKREGIHIPKISYLYLAYLAWATLSALLKADYLAFSIVQLFQEYKYFLVYLYIVNNVRTKEITRSVILILSMILFMEVFVTLSFYAFGYSRDALLSSLNVGREHGYLMEESFAGNERASGTLGSPSNLAMYIQFLFPLPLTLFFTSRKRMAQCLNLGLFLLSLGAMYLSGSRSGMSGFIAGAATCVLLCHIRKYLSIRQVLAILLTGIFLCIGLVAFSSLTDKLYTFIISRPHTYFHRFDLMQEGMRLIAANPLLGVGLNNSTAARLIYAEEMNHDDFAFPIHNHLIVLISETGIVGFILYGAFFLAMGSKALGQSKSVDLHIASLAIAILCSYVALFTHLLGDHFLGNAQNAMLWIYTGLIIALRRIDPPSLIGKADRDLGKRWTTLLGATIR